MIMQVGNAVITRKPGTINGRKNMTKGNFYTEQSLCFRLLSIWLLVLSQLSRKQKWLGWCRWSHRNMAQVSRKNNTICITGNSQETYFRLRSELHLPHPPPPPPTLFEHPKGNNEHVWVKNFETFCLGIVHLKLALVFQPFYHLQAAVHHLPLKWPLITLVDCRKKKGNICKVVVTFCRRGLFIRDSRWTPSVT